ncbi:ATP-binding protein [Streptomyces sp. NPDC002039]|uniref:ATP-binding protein n=1 Tax=Streptomyces sp. NPDC002039 TaxID=3154660 RepID=UPI00331889F3
MSLSRQQQFPRARTSVRAARRFADDTLAVWGISDRLDDVRLCTSELAANAVLHGVPPGREFSVRLVREGGVLWIEVRDSGPGWPVVRRAGGDDRGGRGLWLVNAVADAFEVRGEVVGKTVRVGFGSGSGRAGEECVSGASSGPSGRPGPSGW